MGIHYISIRTFLQLGAIPAFLGATIAVLTLGVRFTGSKGDIIDGTYGSSGFVMGFAGFAIVAETMMIVLRFCNIGAVNLRIQYVINVVSLI